MCFDIIEDIAHLSLETTSLEMGEYVLPTRQRAALVIIDFGGGADC